MHGNRRPTFLFCNVFDVFNEFNSGLRLAKTPYSLTFNWRGKWDVFYCRHRFNPNRISTEQWLVISHRSFFTQRRACFTVIALMLAASPTVILRVLENINIGYGRSLRFMLIANMLSCYLVMTIANFNVYRIICRHQRQIQDNTTMHNFGRSAINVAKYKNL